MTNDPDDDTVMPMKRIAILGSTGSIGTQTLAVIREFPREFSVEVLTAGSNMQRLAGQVREFQPETVVVGNPGLLEVLKDHLISLNGRDIPQIVAGEDALADVVSKTTLDAVVIGLVGFLGLLPTMAALQAGRTVLTANKETFVTAGHLVQPYREQLIPLDSEHSAIFQCLQGAAHPAQEIRKLYLTASGGPFRDWTHEQMDAITVEQALNHPNWTMGQKVTIDSATMMNKGLEIIEAHHLFHVPFEAIEVVVHPQSIVHSAVAYRDGSIIAQLGQPDMRVPIQYGLTWPERWPMTDAQVHLDLPQLGQLDFRPADTERFPCLELARHAGTTGGTLPVVLNAADEMAVSAFLNRQIPFLEIPRVIERLMEQHMATSGWQAHPVLDEIIAVDQWTRRMFEEYRVLQLA